MSGGIPRVQNTLPYQMMAQKPASYVGNQAYDVGTVRYPFSGQSYNQQSPLGQYRNFPVTNPYQAMFQNQLRQPPQQYMQSSPYRNQMKYEPPAPMRFGAIREQLNDPQRGLIFNSDPYNQ